MTTMTGARRLIAVVGTTVAVVLGSALTADAAFSEQVPVASTQIGTATLAPVAGLEVKFVTCTPKTVSAMVEWRRSTARGVSGYRLTAHLQNGQTEVISQTGPDTVEVTISRDRTWVQQRPTFTVTLLTSYGWTSQTAKSAVLSC